MEEAKAVDLNPTSTTTTTTTTSNVNTVAAPQPAMMKVDEGKLLEPSSSTGMSATSGPLGDHMAEVYQEVGHTEEAVNDGH